MYPIFGQTFVYKMYTNCLYIKCIPRFDKLLYTFCIQNLAGVVLLILHTKCIQGFVEIWHTFCIHFVYILYTSVVFIFYNLCIQNVYTVSVWVYAGYIKPGTSFKCSLVALHRWLLEVADV